MRVIITGGGGFLGKRLAAEILRRGHLADSEGRQQPVSELALVDLAPASGEDWLNDARIQQVCGDIADPAVLNEALTPGTRAVFHLAAVVSGQAEADFDIGMKVNVDVTRNLLELCRRLPQPPKFLFTSSIAVFGGRLPAVLPDEQQLTPQGSYGAQKAIGELLVSDLSRRGMIDGRSLRLPTITVRPGKPNRAASSFASGIIREPLAGVEAICPVRPETRMWVQSPQRVIDNILAGFEAPASAFDYSRSVSVPGLSVAVGDMVASLARIAGGETAARVQWQLDPAIDRLVGSWPQAFEATLGQRLGMRADASFDDIVRGYMALNR